MWVLFSDRVFVEFFSRIDSVITPGFIEELDDEGRLMENEYTDFGVTDQECDNMGEMYDLYEGL